MDELIPENLWRQWHASLRRYLSRRIGDAADVEDVLQDVFLKIDANLRGLRDPGRVAAWVYRIADRAVADFYRSRRSWEELPEDFPAPAAGEDCTAELALCLAPMVEALPDTYREAVRLSEIEGLTQKAVAEHLGLSLSGAKSRVQRGREKLRALMLECCHVEADADGLACRPLPDGRRFC